MKYKHLFTSTLLAILITSCNYLDIVPDNIATLEMAFNTRANAEKYLATCYNFVPTIISNGYSVMYIIAQNAITSYLQQPILITTPASSAVEKCGI